MRICVFAFLSPPPLPPGDTVSTARLFDSILSHCIPVVIADGIELPFEEELDYRSFAVFIPEALAVRPDFLISHLRELEKEQAHQLWRRLKKAGR